MAKSNGEFPHAKHDFYKPLAVADPGVPNGLPSLTRQEFAEEADINFLMARYERTGVAPAINGAQPMYVDWTALPTDLMGMLNFFDAAQAQFMQLPATVRREFDNDAAAFVDYASDPENLEQMRKWGLAPAPEVPDAPKVLPPVGNGSPAPAPVEPPKAV